MNNHKRAMILYNDIQKKKKLKAEGVKQAEQYVTELACRSKNGNAKWRTRNPKGRRRID